MHVSYLIIQFENHIVVKDLSRKSLLEVFETGGTNIPIQPFFIKSQI